jgi:hypothetical protein
MKASSTPEPFANSKRHRQTISDPWIHSGLDDAELCPIDFRVLCHILRRGDVCYEKAENIAKVCRIKRGTVFAALSRLEARSMIQRTARQRQSSEIRVTPMSQWKPAQAKTPRGIALGGAPKGTPKVTNGELLEGRTGHRKVGPTIKEVPNEGSPPQEFSSLKKNQDQHSIEATPPPQTSLPGPFPAPPATNGDKPIPPAAEEEPSRAEMEKAYRLDLEKERRERDALYKEGKFSELAAA